MEIADAITFTAYFLHWKKYFNALYCKKSLEIAICRLPINVKVKGEVDNLNNSTQIKLSLMSAISVIDVIIFIILTFLIFWIVGITKDMEMSGVLCLLFGVTIFSFLFTNLLTKFTSIGIDLYTDTVNILIRALQLEEFE